MKSNGNPDDLYLQIIQFQQRNGVPPLNARNIHQHTRNNADERTASGNGRDALQTGGDKKQRWDRPEWWTTRCLLPPMFPVRNLCRQIDLQGWQRDAPACLVESLMQTQCSLPYPWFVHVEWCDDTKAADKCSGDRLLTTTLAFCVVEHRWSWWGFSSDSPHNLLIRPSPLTDVTQKGALNLVESCARWHQWKSGSCSTWFCSVLYILRTDPMSWGMGD